MPIDRGPTGVGPEGVSGAFGMDPIWEEQDS